MKTSTNALTKRSCEMQGFPCATVQAFYGGRRHDLFGIADSLVIQDGVVVFVQNCSYGTLKAHRDEIEANELLPLILHAGVVVQLWEWRRPKLKRGGKNKSRMWQVRKQYRTSGGWSAVESWSDPVDLYPRKK